VIWLQACCATASAAPRRRRRQLLCSPRARPVGGIQPCVAATGGLRALVHGAAGPRPRRTGAPAAAARRAAADAALVLVTAVAQQDRLARVARGCRRPPAGRAAVARAGRRLGPTQGLARAAVARARQLRGRQQRRRPPAPQREAAGVAVRQGRRRWVREVCCENGPVLARRAWLHAAGGGGRCRPLLLSICIQSRSQQGPLQKPQPKRAAQATPHFGMRGCQERGSASSG